MRSKWFNLKKRALKMRADGASIRQVEIKLDIPRSTLSGWFKNIQLSKKHADALQKKWSDGLVSARKIAVQWHNNQKNQRIQIAEGLATEVADKINSSDNNTLEIALAMLYLGEGFKKNLETGIGNSDPLILRFFIASVQKLYAIKIEDFSCYLHLRADQNSDELKSYWSKILGIPLENFRKTSIDQRTAGTATYESYKGVCVVRCSGVAIQRKLVYLSRIYCERVIKNLRD